MAKRLFDIFFSLSGLVLLGPLLILIMIIIKADSKGKVFYIQKRVGKGNKEFRLFKFRTMRNDSDIYGLLTVGNKDPRITSSGYYLRKYKLDEIPQLYNVLKGEMSFVGPRPEVRKYVELYNKEQMKVLDVKPGITDLASVKYRNENELLAGSDDPEKLYTKEIMPDKLRINLEYISERSLIKDIRIIIQTLKAVIM